jgi:cysteine-rich repeat protein
MASVAVRRIRATLLLALVALLSGHCGGDAPPPAPLPACGDGVVQAREECDDGNPDNGDGCLTTCLRPLTWALGEPHVHGTGCGGHRDPFQLVGLLQSSDLNIGSALVWGHNYRLESIYFTGDDDRNSLPDHLLHYDLEISSLGPSRLGHLILLGIRALNFSTAIDYEPKSGVPVVDWARGQDPRVAVGMAHAQFWPADGSYQEFPVRRCCLPPDDCCVPWELPIHVARGRMHFMVTEQVGDRGPLADGAFLLWTKLLNAGFRVTMTGGSDLPCIERDFTARTPRTAVFVDGAITYDKWLESLRLGHAVVTVPDGDRLNLRVNGVRLGGEVRVAAGVAVSITVEGRFAQADQVDLLANGVTIASFPVNPGPQAFETRLVMPASAWLVARTHRDLTNPVYVLVSDQPIRTSAADACYLIRYVDHLRNLVLARKIRLGVSQGEAFAAYDEAQALFRQRFAEAGGTTCP